MGKKRVLFICTYNSCRSQMAEGTLRSLAGDRYEAYSAGIEPTGVNPYSIKVMAEIGIDISGHRSKSVNEFQDQQFDGSTLSSSKGRRIDYVVTVCDSARQTCPVFSGKHEMIHWDLEDPARAEGDEQEKLAAFRKIRDQIKQRIIKKFVL